LLSSINPTPPPPFYTISLHDALPISVTLLRPKRFASLKLLLLYSSVPVVGVSRSRPAHPHGIGNPRRHPLALVAIFRSTLPPSLDRKSTRLNSSHVAISYAVFCLKKK